MSLKDSSLDFTRLNGLTSMDLYGLPSESPSEARRMPIDAQDIGDSVENIRDVSNAGKGHCRVSDGISALQRRADLNKAETERAAAVYKAYQTNIGLCGQLKTDILHGLEAGENICALFLKAVRAISLMTDDRVFYDRSQADINAIYGHGLGCGPVIKEESNDVRTRLDMLRSAARSESDPAALSRIKAAIKTHETLAENLDKMFEKA